MNLFAGLNTGQTDINFRMFEFIVLIKTSLGPIRFLTVLHTALVESLDFLGSSSESSISVLITIVEARCFLILHK